MGKITGRNHYCVHCHERPIPDDEWKRGGEGSRLCKVCYAKKYAKRKAK